MKCSRTVGDTGVGIAPEDQETVFEEFRQVGTAAYTVEGTGLGLVLSEVCRAARWSDLGAERGGRGLHVHVHAAGPSEQLRSVLKILVP
jgi:K+-sensing histidine kinase KdpD